MEDDDEDDGEIDDEDYRTRTPRTTKTRMKGNSGGMTMMEHSIVANQVSWKQYVCESFC